MIVYTTEDGASVSPFENAIGDGFFSFEPVPGSELPAGERVIVELPDGLASTAAFVDETQAQLQVHEEPDREIPRFEVVPGQVLDPGRHATTLVLKGTSGQLTSIAAAHEVTADGSDGVWTASYLEPQSGLEALRPAELIAVVETADPNQAQVVFWAGSQECEGLDHVTVDETDEQVAIDVVVGRRVPADTACVDIARRYTTTIELDQPLGDREVVDGEGVVVERPDVPVDYATAAFEAWLAGDSATLRQLSTDPAYEVLTGRPPAAEDGWAPEPSCEGAAGSTYCQWSGTDENLILRVGNEAVANGEVALLEARFEQA
jgi:hypothetical protein